MFGDKKPAPQKRIDSLIGAGTVVRGDLVFTGGLRIDGQVHGNVSCAEGQSGTLVVSEQARIEGEVKVSHVVVNDTMNGTKSSISRATLTESGAVVEFKRAAAE